MKSALVKIFLPILSVLFVLFAAEFVLRIVQDEKPYPGMALVEGVEFLHKAGEPGVNSLGFIDKERKVEKQSDVFRILLLGDSFIDGQNVDVYLEQELAKAMPDRKFEVIPMGISGTGTLSHLAFYEKIGRRFSPDMVVDVFVPNDFANNSNILESVRLRFHPFKPGRTFASKVISDGKQTIERINPVSDFEKHVLKELPSHPQQSIFRLLERKMDGLLSNSKVYGFMRNAIYLNDEESLYHRFDGELAYRICQLRLIPGVADKLEGWNFPNDLEIEAMFLLDGDNMPPAFSDAIDYTKYAFQQFNKLSASDGFIFLEVFSDSCTYFPDSWLTDWRRQADKGNRSIKTENFMVRLEKIAVDANIDYYNLYPSFAARGDIRKAHLPNDNHWSDFGKRFAAEDMALHIKKILSK